MKKSLILGWLLGCLPVWAGAQVVDTAAVVREVDSLINMSRTLTDQRALERALEVNIVAEKLALEQLGRMTAAYASACFNHGYMLYLKQDYLEAEKWYLESKNIREKVLGKEDLLYALSINNLGNTCVNIGKYEQAEALHLEAKSIREKKGKENAAYSNSVFNLGRLYWLTGKYELAEQYYLEAISVREMVYGKKHSEYSLALNALSILYTDIGRYKEAVSLNLESLSITEEAGGKESLQYAFKLGNLAILYDEMGQFDKSEACYLETKRIFEKTIGREDLDYLALLINLARFYKPLGQYDKAEILLLEAGRIFDTHSDFKSHHFYFNYLMQLGGLYEKTNRYLNAEATWLQAKTISEKVHGKEDINYSYVLGNLANLYQEMGRFKEAEHLQLECKRIIEKKFGQEHRMYTVSLSNLANLYQEMGRYDEAIRLNLESKFIQEKILSKEHPSYSVSLRNLSNLYAIKGDYELADQLSREFQKTNHLLLGKSAQYLSERELSSYVQVLEADIENNCSLLQNRPGNKGIFVEICYDDALFYKGFILNSSARLKMRGMGDSLLAEKFETLASFHQRLSKEYTKPIAERNGARVNDLEEKANSLEKELARSVAGYGNAIRQVEWSEVQATLKSDEAAIEFVHYQFSNPKPTDSILYAALVLLPGDTQPHFIPLFEEKELAQILKGAAGGSNFLKINALYATKTAGNKPSSAPSFVKTSADEKALADKPSSAQASADKQKSLYELIWKPLQSLLTGTKTVYCSPSGLLHRINLAAIPASDGKAFGDNHQLVLLGSTRQLVLPTAISPSERSAYLVGGIRYDTDSTAIAYANRSTSSGSRSIEQPNPLPFQPDTLSATRGGILDYLPATAAEVREIGQTLAASGIRAQIDTGFYATEETFRQLGVGAPSPRIVHLATHGYFFPDPVSKAQKAPGNFGQEPVFKMSDHPMIRSGLIMAGAKQAWLTGKHPEGQEDGILTAYEISQMNLSGTELVVLSACETGLGDIMGNEGVYGLQRAFKIAGAKYLIMSLWKVDDRSTQEFMTAFYRHWLTDKQPVPQAFRTAQREMRAKHPGAYDWAGFVLIE